MTVLSTSWLFFQLFNPLLFVSLPAIPILSHNPTACNNYLLTSFHQAFKGDQSVKLSTEEEAHHQAG
jgi:hypothetical protein